MAEIGKESSDSSSPSNEDYCEDLESPSPSSRSEESVNEDEPDTSSISRPLSSKKKMNDSQLQSVGKATEKQEQKNKKQNFSLSNDEIEELTSWIFSSQEATQLGAEIHPQVAGSPCMRVFSEREHFTNHVLNKEQ